MPVHNVHADLYEGLELLTWPESRAAQRGYNVDALKWSIAKTEG